MFTRSVISVYTTILTIYTFCSSISATLYEGDKCFLLDGNTGTCKYITKCKAAINLLRSGIYPSLCGFEGTQSIICCKNKKVTTRVPPFLHTSIHAPNRAANRTPGDISKQKCKEYALHAFERTQSPTLSLIPHFSNTLECDMHRVKLIVGGMMASRKEFPHMALIGYENGPEVVWGCAGSLISENFVLTAAHCLKKRDLGAAKLVRVGLANKTDLSHVQERSVAEIIAHPKFGYARYHDIGLLRLARRIDCNIYARPACLQAERDISESRAIVAGWGATEHLGQFNNDLLKVVLEFFSVDKCNHTYRQDILFGSRLRDGIDDDLMICAGSSKDLKDSCQGDSGGPLMVYHEETEDVKCMYDIVGVTSFGKSCGLMKNVPGVYTRVSAYIKWIEDTVWPN